MLPLLCCTLQRSVRSGTSRQSAKSKSRRIRTQNARKAEQFLSDYLQDPLLADESMETGSVQSGATGDSQDRFRCVCMSEYDVASLYMVGVYFL